MTESSRYGKHSSKKERRWDARRFLRSGVRPSAISPNYRLWNFRSPGFRRKRLQFPPEMRVLRFTRKSAMSLSAQEPAFTASNGLGSLRSNGSLAQTMRFG